MGYTFVVVFCQDQAAKDKAMQSMSTMSSAQIISATAFQNKMALQGLSRPAYPTAAGVSVSEHLPSLMIDLSEVFSSGRRLILISCLCFRSFGMELSQDKPQVLKSKFMFCVSVNILVIRSGRFTRIRTSESV